MRILLYIGPASLGAAIALLALGNKEAATLAVWGWIIFSLVGLVARPRNIPELIMVAGNGLLVLLAFAVTVFTRVS